MKPLPVVSWAGPLERARQALDRASHHLSLNHRDAGMTELAEMQRQVNLTVEFIVAEECKRVG